MLVRHRLFTTVAGLLLAGASFCHAAASQPIAVSPNTGVGSTQAFTVMVDQPSAVGTVIFAVSFSESPFRVCRAEYVRNANQLRLMDDLAAGYSVPVTPGANAQVSNSQCTLSGLGASVSQSGTTLSITFPLTFKPMFRGVHNLYSAVIDTQNAFSEFKFLGSYNVLGPPPAPIAARPGVSSELVMSNVPQTTPQTYQFHVFSKHAGGPAYSYLTYLLLLPLPNRPAFTADGVCLVEYNKLSHGVRLIDNAGTGWLGPLEGVPVRPTAPVLENNSCLVDVSATRVSIANLTDIASASVQVRFQVTPKPALSGPVGVFHQVLDVMGNWTDFRQTADLTFYPGGPRPGPGVIALNQHLEGTAAVARVNVRHSAGAGQLGAIHVRFSRLIVSADLDPGHVPDVVCHLFYYHNADALGLVNDAGTDLVAPGVVPRGSATVLTNNRCSLNVGAVTVTAVGNTLELGLPVTMTPVSSQNDDVNIRVNAFDVSNTMLSHWIQTGTWQVTPSCSLRGCL